MKANQTPINRFLKEEDAVSPVIAVILMVAITVVLAATVFVLVSDLGGDVGKSGPKLSLVSDSTTSTTKWIVKTTDATQSANLADYQFVVSTPSHGTIVIDPDNTTFTTPASWLGDAGASPTSTTRTVAAAGSMHPAATFSYVFTFTDISGDGKFNTLDTVQMTYDSDDALTAVNSFTSGAFKMELRHKPTNTATGSVEQGF